MVKIITPPLDPFASHIVTLTTNHEPNRFFQNSPFLWVDDSFRSIVNVAGSSKSGTIYKVSSFILRRDLYDSGSNGIEAALPADHFFGETEVCAVIAHLIGENLRGRHFGLNRAGYSNIFFTSSRVVKLCANASASGWNVRSFSRGGNYFTWRDRVFSPM